MVIQNNIMALNAYNRLNANSNALAKNLEKLSSGYRINRAGDDAAGLAISEKMRAQLTGLEASERNAKDGISLIQTAEGALSEVHSMLNRMVDLATQASNGTYDDKVDRAALDNEFQQLKEEIDRISKATNFNGLNLLDGSLSNKGITGGSTFGKTEVTAGVNAEFTFSGAANLLTTTAAVTAVYEFDLSGVFNGSWDNIGSMDGEVFTLTVGNTSQTFYVGGSSPSAGVHQFNDFDSLSDAIDAAFSAANISATFELTSDFKIRVTNDTAGALTTGIEDFSGSIKLASAYGGTKINSETTTVGADTIDAVQDGEDIYIGGVTFTYTTGATAGQLTAFADMDDLLTKLDQQFTDFTFSIKGNDIVASAKLATSNVADLSAGIDTQTHSYTGDIIEGKNAELIGGGENRVSTDLSKVFYFGTTGKVDGKGTEYRISGGKNTEDGKSNVEKFQDLNKISPNDAFNENYYADALGLSLNDYKIYEANDGTGDIVIERLATGAVDPNEQAIFSNSKGLVHLEEKGTEDYRELTLRIDKAHIGDTNLMGKKLTINGTEYTFAAQSDLDEKGNYVTSGARMSDGSYAIDISAATHGDVDEYAKQVMEQIVAAVNTAEATIRRTDGMDFAVTGKGYADPVSTTASSNDEIATFNIKLAASGNVGTGTPSGGLKLQIGDTADDYNMLGVSVEDMSTEGIGVADLSIDSLENAVKALGTKDSQTEEGTVRGAINAVSTQRAILGALQNRLEHTISNIGVTTENITAAESRIRDTDMAKEMMMYTKNNILLQASQAMLAQANQVPQGVLQLIRG